MGAGAIHLVERETSTSPSLITYQIWLLQNRITAEPGVPELREAEAIRQGTVGCRLMLRC
jgi:hypothetical protein